MDLRIGISEHTLMQAKLKTKGHALMQETPMAAYQGVFFEDISWYNRSWLRDQA